jgi:hypothetical protein
MIRWIVYGLKPVPTSRHLAVVGLRWSKRSEQHGQDKHPRGSLGYARDRLFDSAPPSAVSRDKSVRRSAQDDVFVGVLNKNIQNKLALMGCSPFQRYCDKGKRLRPRARIPVHRVRAFEKSVFGPCIRISCTGHHQHPRVRLSLRKAA